jgi:hypothetical protein
MSSRAASARSVPAIRSGASAPDRTAGRATVTYREIQPDDYVTYRTPRHRFRSGRALSWTGEVLIVRAYSKEHETVEVTEAMFQYGGRTKTSRVTASAG